MQFFSGEFGTDDIGNKVKCQFPFVYQGAVFHGCARNSSGGLWCSTKTKDYNHVTGHSATCLSKKCVISDPECATGVGNNKNSTNLIGTTLGNKIASAIRKNDMAAFKESMEGYFDDNPLVQLGSCSDTKYSVAHWAAYNGRLEMLKLVTSQLLDKNPRTFDSGIFRGRIPLHFSAQNGHLETVKHQMKCLANKNPGDDNGSTPLHFAARFGRINVVKDMVAKLSKNEIEAKDNKGKTALDHAKRMNRQDIVDILSNL